MFHGDPSREEGVTVRVGGHNRVQRGDSRAVRRLPLEKSAEVTIALYPVESFPSAVIGGRGEGERGRRMNVVGGGGLVRSSE